MVRLRDFILFCSEKIQSWILFNFLTPFKLFKILILDVSQYSVAGRYSPAKGVQIASDCIVCSAGTYGTEIGCNVNIADPKIVDTVTTSAGTTTAPDRSCTYSCRPCERGKWSDETGATASSICQLCPEGKFLNTRGNVELADCK